MGKISKGVNCSIIGCSEKAIKSLSTSKVVSIDFQISSKHRRVYLCEKHYKEYKKKIKNKEKMEKWRYKPF